MKYFLFDNLVYTVVAKGKNCYNLSFTISAFLGILQSKFQTSLKEL